MNEHEPTIVLLIRHASTDAVGVRLVSRLPGVHLSASGMAQVERLRANLAAYAIDILYSSPLERALETAQPIAADRGLDLRVDAALTEVEFGDWTGLTFDELAALPSWRRFNEARAVAEVPNGERAVDVQRRILTALESIRRTHAGKTTALVTHAEVIRCAVLHIAGMPLDCWPSVEISPASITAIRYDDECPRLLLVNGTADHWPDRGGRFASPQP